MKKIKLLCVVGPTASGKTGLGIELAKKLSGEIVSADSMQIYKGIHIASAAPDEAEKQGIREKVKIMVGGAPVTEGFAAQIGADKYTSDAASAADAAVAFCAELA